MRRLALLLAGPAAALAACASTAATSTTSTTTDTASSPGTSPAPTAAPAATPSPRIATASPTLATAVPSPSASRTPNPPSRLLVATDADRGRTLTMRTGDLLRVTLASTYWTIAGSSSPTVLQAVSTQSASPQPSGCVPGGGCGTVTETFAARSPGRATITASRTSCGEALACTGGAGAYAVTVVVTG